MIPKKEKKNLKGVFKLLQPYIFPIKVSRVFKFYFLLNNKNKNIVTYTSFYFFFFFCTEGNIFHMSTNAMQLSTVP